MATRSIRFVGAAYSVDGDVSMIINFNGTEVHNGPVRTIASFPPAKNDYAQGFVTITVDEAEWGHAVPVEITVTNGTAYLAAFAANKIDKAQHSLMVKVSAGTPQIKKNIKLDGVLLDAVEPEDGTHYPVTDGEILQFELDLPQVPRLVAGHYTAAATALVIGDRYVIDVLGDTDFTLVGAADNQVGVPFTATGAGTGTGIAYVI